MSVYAIILSAAPVITLREAQHNRTSDVPAMIKRVRQERGTLKYAAQTLQTVVIIALKTTALSSTKHTYGHNNKRLQRSQRKAAAESQVFLECIVHYRLRTVDLSWYSESIPRMRYNDFANSQNSYNSLHSSGSSADGRIMGTWSTAGELFNNITMFKYSAYPLFVSWFVKLKRTLNAKKYNKSEQQSCR